MNVSEIIDDDNKNDIVIEISPLYLLLSMIVPCALSLICILSFFICNIIRFFKK